MAEGTLAVVPSVLFREAPPAVDALIEERRHTGADRFDEVWEGVYVVNPPPSFGHAILSDRIVDLLRPLAAPLGLVVTREVGIGRSDDHRIPDVVVADPAHLDQVGHYLLTAAIAVEVRSPSERVDKRPFYLANNVAEVVLVDPSAGTVDWYRMSPDGSGYQSVESSAVLPVRPSQVAALLDT